MTFSQECYKLLERIPRGKVTTYAEIALALETKAYRAVGSAMAKNKNLIIIPCHRVVRSDGSIGQYALGSDKKIELLQSEGVMIQNSKVCNFEELLFRF